MEGSSMQVHAEGIVSHHHSHHKVKRRHSMHKSKHFTSEDDAKEDDNDIAHPAVQIIYEFCMDVHSGKFALIFGYFTAVLSFASFIVLTVESMDGPNKFEGREDMSTYPSLPYEYTYKIVDTCVFMPVIFDSLVKFILIVCMQFRGNAILSNFFYSDNQKFERFCCCIEAIGVVPNLIILSFNYSSYSFSDWPAIVRATVRGWQMTNMVRILRLSKDVPAMWAIRITLANAGPQLILPVFFFFLFNVSAGVILFFVEPCFDDSSCPWHDLFEATYFSVVSMTTVGYGDVYPEFELARFFTLCVCFFGALFVSMPLSVIGNEYESAWAIVTEKLLNEQKEKDAEKRQKEEVIRAYKKEMAMLNETGKVRSRLLEAKARGVGQATDESDLLLEDDAEHHDEDEQTLSTQTKHRGESLDSQASIPLEQTKDDSLKDKSKRLESILKEHDMSTAVKLSPLSLAYVDMNRAANNLCREMEDMHPDNRHLNPGMLQGLVYMRDSSLALYHQLDSCLSRVSSNMTDDAYANAIGYIRDTSLKAMREVARRHRPTAYMKQKKRVEVPRRPSILGTAKLPNMEGLGFLREVQNQAQSDHFKTFYRKAWVQRRSKDGKSITDDFNDDMGTYRMRGNKAKVQSSKNSFSGAIEELGADEGEEKKHDEDDDVEDDSHEYKFGTTEQVFREVLSYVKSWLVHFGIMSAPVVPVKQKNDLLREDKEEEKGISRQEKILIERLKDVEENPESLTNRIWVMLEIPTSSREARLLRYTTIFLIIFSVFLLYTETLTTFNTYGEDTHYCHDILKMYCADKDPLSDPGCFVQNEFGVASDTPLKYGCKDFDCIGHGHNFGSGIGNTNMTCDASSTLQAFAAPEELIYRYKHPTVFQSRETRQFQTAICNRVECRLGGEAAFPGHRYWLAAEITINLLFTIELIARIIASNSVYDYFADKVNFVDIIVILPFYVELLRAQYYEVKLGDIDFSILPSSAEPILYVAMRSLKVGRLFKLSRHFRASRVLLETASQAGSQIASILILLMFLVFVFATMLFEVEGGIPCFVGDENCILFPDDALLYQIGDRVLIAKDGTISKMPDVFKTLWFSFVTITTVGYGDIYPITNGGRVMAITLMLAGTMFMSIPLTVAGNIYYDTHCKFMNEHQLAEQHHRKEIAMRIAAAAAAIDQAMQDQQSNNKALSQGASLAAIEAMENNETCELEFGDALIAKYIQKQCMDIHMELCKISNTLMSSILETPYDEDGEPLTVRLSSLAKETAAMVMCSEGVTSSLAEMSYSREIQLSKLAMPVE